MFDDYAPCAVCGSKVDLVGRDGGPPVADEDTPVGPDHGVVGAGDEPVDARVCTNPDCPTHTEGGDTP